MPELAEVAYYAKQWNAGLGKRVLDVKLHPKARVFRSITRPQSLFSAIRGECFRSFHTHGKQMCFQFGDVWLVGHLGMTGKLWVAAKEHEIEKHDHLVFEQATRQLVFTDPRMFGQWQLLTAEAFSSFQEALPPEVTSPAFTKERLRTFLQRRSRSPLKAVLLMQETFPGIGNWMADEILWRAKLDPRRHAGSLAEHECDLLWRKTRLVCRQAMRVIGDDWSTPPSSWLFNHRWKDGGRCPCGAPLERETIGGRTTCWCPTCQEQ